MEEWLKQLWQDVRPHLPTVGIALGILIGGWIAALVLRRLTYSLLKKTTLDDKIAHYMGFETGGEHGSRIERYIAKFVYYLALVVVFVIFFSFLKIDAILQPLVSLLNGLAGSVPNLLKALAIGAAGVAAAFIVRTLLRRALRAARFDERIARLEKDDTPAARKGQPADESSSLQAEAAPSKKSEERKSGKKRADKAADKKKVDPSNQPLSDIIANIAFWAILVVTAVGVLEALQIKLLAGPLSIVIERVTEYLPRIAGATIILALGYVGGRLVRSVVTTLLSQIGLDRAVRRFGLHKLLGKQPLSRIVGTLAMAFVLLHAAISAVERLDIRAVSEPAGQVLTQIYAYLPKLFVGGLLMVLGVALARVAGNLLARIAAALGFDGLIEHMGLREPKAATSPAEAESSTPQEASGAPPTGADEIDEADEEESDAEPEDVRRLLDAGRTIRKPSDLLGVVVAAVIVLLFLRQALSTMTLDGLATMFDRLLSWLPQVAVAAVVVGAGLWVGRWSQRRVDELTRKSQDRIARALGPLCRVAIIAFAAMVALQQLGVGERLITVGFAIILGSACLAAALAFGLGGREVAGKILSKEYDKRQR